MKSSRNASKALIASIILVTLSFSWVKADEGMWMINNLSARTDSILRSMGLELTHEQLYSEDKPSLNDAIVCFGGFCSGVVVSDEGLVFTNHHCGYNAIQTHSTPKKDYLTNGFFAKKQGDELPNEGLYVDFHLKTIDVTDQLEEVADSDMEEVAGKIQEQFKDSVNGIFAVVSPYYKGHKYYLSVYQRYTDVRLVFAPPQCLGKHGGDTDNWVWPRQTCDFSVFRIYADKQNHPAKYSKQNVPFRPKNFARISLNGYQPGTYCMTLGYPGSTERYLSSYGIESTMRNENAVRIQVRGIKQSIMKEAMNSRDELRIMYSSKYASSSNYWKYSIGQNDALKNLNVVEEKRELEKSVPSELLEKLKEEYVRNDSSLFVMAMVEESFAESSDILQIALMNMLSVLKSEERSIEDIRKDFEKSYKDIDIETDKAILSAMIKNYREKVNKGAWPDFFAVIDTVCNGDVDAYIDAMYKVSMFADKEKITHLERVEDLFNDVMTDMAMDVMKCVFKYMTPNAIDSLESELLVCLQKANPAKEYYPDANSTLRMSFGSVEEYSVAGKESGYYTIPQSLLDKNIRFPENSDYFLLPEVKRWFEKGRFGDQYKDRKNGDLQLCFITTNDITGGNSGSGMFDGKGRLIGLAFDGNWEAMSGDLKFDNKLQRCIGVDIRYVLSIIENYGKAKRLIKELTFE